MVDIKEKLERETTVAVRIGHCPSTYQGVA
jgi:hypothetical protein